MYKDSLFSTFSPTFDNYLIFGGSHCDRCEVISHCGFDLHFPDDYQCWASLHASVAHLHFVFWKMSIQFLCPFILDCKETKPVNPKRNQPWIFTGRTDAEAPILWPPDAKNWLIGKVPHAGKDWGQKEKGATEDEIVGWHHQPNGHELGQTLGDSEGQRRLACCSPRGRRVRQD